MPNGQGTISAQLLGPTCRRRLKLSHGSKVVKENDSETVDRCATSFRKEGQRSTTEKRLSVPKTQDKFVDILYYSS